MPCKSGIVISPAPLLTTKCTIRCSFTVSPGSGLCEITCPAGTSELVTSELETRRCRSSNNRVATLNCFPTTFGTSTVELLQKLPKLKKAHKNAKIKANTAPPMMYFCGKLPNLPSKPS